MLANLLALINYHSPLFYLTQSIWRDEGFSFFMARPNLIQIIINTVNDFNPPLYYLTMHIFMRIFGETDIALRMLSFVFHLMTVYCSFLLAKKIFDKKFAYFVASFTFLNPFLLYYAFEIRMYSMFAFFTMASLYFFISKRWRPYILVTTLGIYTHSFFVFVIISEMAYLYLSKQFTKKYILQILKPVLLFIPWMPVLIWQFGQAKKTWIFPVDGQLIKSALGNLFINYDGTPGGLWGVTAIISLIILVFILISIKRNKKNILFAVLILLPLVVVLFYSVLRQPIYVNRYVIFVTVGEILTISGAIFSIRNKSLRNLLMGLWLVFVLIINIITPQFHKKVDFRSTIVEIAKLAKPTDYVYSQTPLSYFESAFYYPNKEKVFIYNPQNIAVPNYIGTAVIAKNKSVIDFPQFPSRTFLIHDDGSFEMVIKTNNLKLN